MLNQYHARAMSKSFIIDSLEFARGLKTHAFSLEAADMPKIIEMAVQTVEPLSVKVGGGVRRDGKAFIDLEIVGSLLLECQRCLEGFESQINSRSRFIIAPTENDLTDLSEESDDVNSILGEHEFDLIGFVENELVLSLPMIPMHDEGVCTRPASITDSDNVTNPFRILKR